MYADLFIMIQELSCVLTFHVILFSMNSRTSSLNKSSTYGRVWFTAHRSQARSREPGSLRPGRTHARSLRLVTCVSPNRLQTNAVWLSGPALSWWLFCRAQPLHMHLVYQASLAAGKRSISPYLQSLAEGRFLHHAGQAQTSAQVTKHSVVASREPGWAAYREPNMPLTHTSLWKRHVNKLYKSLNSQLVRAEQSRVWLGICSPWHPDLICASAPTVAAAPNILQKISVLYFFYLFASLGTARSATSPSVHRSRDAACFFSRCLIQCWYNHISLPYG